MGDTMRKLESTNGTKSKFDPTPLYYISIFLQGLTITSMLVNCIYCIVAHKRIIYLTSNSIFEIPCFRYLINGNIIDLLVTIAVVIVTTVLFILSAKALFLEDVKSNVCLAINSVWLIYGCMFASLIAMNHTTTSSNDDSSVLTFAINYISAYIFIIAVIVKLYQHVKHKKQQRLETSSKIPVSDLTISKANYKSVFMLANFGSTIVDVVIFLLISYSAYLAQNVSTSIDKLYMITVIASFVFILLANYQYFALKKSGKDKTKRKFVALKLNLLPVCVLILFALSYLLFI